MRFILSTFRNRAFAQPLQAEVVYALFSFENWTAAASEAVSPLELCARRAFYKP